MGNIDDFKTPDIVEVRGFSYTKNGKIYPYRYEAVDGWFKESLEKLFANKSVVELLRAIREDKAFRDKLVLLFEKYEEEE